MKTRSIFKRLLLVNLILVIFAVIIPSRILYSYSIGYIYNSIHDYNITKVQNVSNMIDKHIEDIIKIPIANFTNLITNQNLITPLYRDISTDSNKIRQINNELINLEHKNNGYYKLSLYYMNGEIFFHNSTINFMGDESKNKVKIPGWIKEGKNINMLWHIEKEENGEEYITYVRSIPLFGEIEKRKGLIGVGISTKKIDDIINNNLSNHKINQQIIIVQDNNQLVTSYPDKIQENKLNTVITQLNTYESNDDNLYEVIIGDKKVLASIIYSKYNTWKYIALSSLDTYYETANQYQIVYNIIILLIILLNLLIAYWGIYRAYRPVKKIVKIFKGIFKEDKSGNEYDYIIHAASNVESRMEELKNKISKYQPLIQYNLIWELLNNIKNDTQQEILKASELIFNQDKNCCIILRVHHSHVLENKILLNYKIINAINEQENKENYYPVLTENNDIVILVNYQKELGRVTGNIIETVETCMSYKYSLCIGEEVNDVSHISQSYETAKHVLRWVFFKYKDKVITYEDVNNQNLKRQGSAYKVLNHIEDKFKSCKLGETQFLVSGLIAGLKEEHYRIQYCENTISELCSRLRSVFIQRGFECDEVLDYDIRDLVYIVSNVDELEEQINKVIFTMIRHIMDKKDKLPIVLESKIDQYIENNIYNDISLERMASDLNINYEVMSKQFKDIKGITFSKYIIELKMRCAKELLLNTSLTVGEISSKLGYNATPYFIRLFRNKYNQTPLQYKKTTKYD